MNPDSESNSQTQLGLAGNCRWQLERRHERAGSQKQILDPTVQSTFELHLRPIRWYQTEGHLVAVLVLSLLDAPGLLDAPLVSQAYIKSNHQSVWFQECGGFWLRYTHFMWRTKLIGDRVMADWDSTSRLEMVACFEEIWPLNWLGFGPVGVFSTKRWLCVKMRIVMISLKLNFASISLIFGKKRLSVCYHRRGRFQITIVISMRYRISIMRLIFICPDGGTLWNQCLLQ